MFLLIVGVWTRWPFKVLSNQNYSMSLWLWILSVSHFTISKCIFRERVVFKPSSVVPLHSAALLLSVLSWVSVHCAVNYIIVSFHWRSNIRNPILVILKNLPGSGVPLQPHHQWNCQKTMVCEDLYELHLLPAIYSAVETKSFAFLTLLEIPLPQVGTCELRCCGWTVCYLL